DPRFVDAFFACAPEVVALLSRESIWETFLEAEPTPHAERSSEALPEIAEVFADYVDLKSPYTIGHSPGVAALVLRTAGVLGLDVESARRAHLAALLHDLGRVAVPNGIWDKPGPLGPIERERVSSHAGHTLRILSRSPLFAGI